MLLSKDKAEKMREAMREVRFDHMAEDIDKIVVGFTEPEMKTGFGDEEYVCLVKDKNHEVYQVCIDEMPFTLKYHNAVYIINKTTNVGLMCNLNSIRQANPYDWIVEKNGVKWKATYHCDGENVVIEYQLNSAIIWNIHNFKIKAGKQLCEAMHIPIKPYREI